MIASTPRSIAIALALGAAAGCIPRVPTRADPPTPPADPPTPPADPPTEVPPAATVGVHAVEDDPFPCAAQDPGIACAGVATNPDGDLVLAGSTVERRHVWIVNDTQATVSKLDIRSGREVARYASVTHARLIDHTGGRPVAAWGKSVAGGRGPHQPSRIAVDLDGNVWVANRAPETQPSITKIWGRNGDCVDRNGNGTIDTSRDASGDGAIDIDDATEFLGEADECIAMTVAVGGSPRNDYQARALAIQPGPGGAGAGTVWVGMYTEQAFYQINGSDGSLLQRVPPAGNFTSVLGQRVEPYGAAIDGAGHLWSIGGCCASQHLIRIDTTTSPATVSLVSAPSPGGAYGLAVDLMNRIWLGAYTGPDVYRYDPAANAWTTVTIPNSAGWRTRGVGIDTLGNVWTAMHGGANSRVARIKADTATVTARDLFDVGGNTAIGVGVDFAGDVWAVNQTTSNVSRLHLDPVTGEPADHPGTPATTPVDTFPTGPNPYTYADFTGLGLRALTPSSGEYKVPLRGCPDGRVATWANVTWSATEPPGTKVELFVHAGDDLATLPQAPRFGPWRTSPADLTIPPGPVPPARQLGLVIRLHADRGTVTPVVHGYRVDWGCPG